MTRRIECRGAAWRWLATTALTFTLAAGAQAQVDVSLLSGLEARAIGPAGMSGRIAAIDVVLSDPRILYAATATGGVFKSVDGGATWSPIFDDQPVAATGSVAIFQPSPDVVWVGSGEGNPRNSVSVGNGIYRSLDAGATWEHLGLERTERIHRVRLHPTNRNVAYACAMGQAWGENEERGVFKTTDFGASWEKVLYVDEKTGCADLAMDPSNPERLIASMWQYRRWPWAFSSGGPSSGVYQTSDGGKTWSRYEVSDGMPKGTLGRAGIAFSLSDPQVVYALVEAKKSALLRSEDGGRSFEAVNSSPNVAPRPFYYCDIRVDPQQPNRVYNLHSSIEVSDDGGRSFRTLAGFESLHSDHHELWIHPDDPLHLVNGNDGGIGISRDRGENWTFVRNLPLAQFYHVRVDMDRPYNVYGGLQDNGSWRGPSAVWEGGFGGGIRNFHWTMVAFGDGFDTAADPESSMRGYAMSQGGNLSKWDLSTGGSKSIRPDGPDDVELRFNWNAGFAQDPFDVSTIYYGSQFVHKSTDRGETWRRISEDLTTNNEEWQLQAESGGLTPDVTAAENFTTILSIEPSPLERDVLWVGTDDGRLHVTRDGGGSWSSLEDRVGGVPADTWIPHITPSRFDAGEAFVIFDNHRNSDLETYVYRVSDYGGRIERLPTEGVEGYALKLEQDLVREDLLFLGTEFGLWISFDDARSWHKWTHGVPTVSVMDLALHPREHDLVLGTHGRSIFIIDDIRPLREIDAELLERELHLFEIPDAQQAQIGPQAGELAPGQTEFRGQNRPYGALLTFSLGDASLPHPDAAIERARIVEERTSSATEGEDTPGDGPRAESKVEIEIAQGDEVIRTFERPVHRGVNRISWDLRRDAFKRPGGGGGSFFGRGGGPEVLPGSYTVRVSYGEASAEGNVEVLADPRIEWNRTDREANLEAVLRAGQLVERIADATDRIASVRRDLDLIEAKVKDASDDTESDAATEEEADEVSLDDAIANARKRLDELENQLWTPPGTRGIVARSRAIHRAQNALRSLQSSWDAPNATQLTHLRQAEAYAEPVISELNDFLATDVTQLEQRVAEAGIRLLDQEALDASSGN